MVSGFEIRDTNSSPHTVKQTRPRGQGFSAVTYDFRHYSQDEGHFLTQTLVGSRLKSMKKPMEGKHLRVTSFLIEPSMVVNQAGLPIGGHFYELLLHAARHYNFTFDLEVPKFKGTVQLKNGSFLGPIGQVARGERDLILGCAQTLERSTQIDFSTYLDVTELKFIAPHPKVDLRWEAIAFIFPLNVWILLALVCAAMTYLFYFFEKRHENRKMDGSSQKLPSEALYRASVITLCPIVEQDGGFQPKSFIRRLFLFSWVFNCLTVTTFYKSDFIAYLTFPEPEETPETFKQLSENSHFNIKFMSMNAAESLFFNKSRNPMHVNLRNRFLPEPNKLNCIKSVIFERKTVCIGYQSIIAVEASKNLTLRRDFLPFRYSKDTAMLLTLNIGLSKGSEYIDGLSYFGAIVRDTGIMTKWKNDAYGIRQVEGMEWLKAEGGKLRTVCKAKVIVQPDSAEKPLAGKNLVCGFLVLSVGLLSATLVYGLEFVTWTLHQRRAQVQSLLADMETESYEGELPVAVAHGVPLIL